jgi:hypothetical protein
VSPKLPDREKGVRLADLLEPILNARDGDDRGLLDAINLVAEAIAALEIILVDEAGRPIPGVSDKTAVLALLRSHRQELARGGQMEESLTLRDLARRVKGLR